ncbi:hypothetical protein RV134_220015 [Roseovarius sp. EC-HK134]|nr:hypothetical protein RV134_220015 [Roseovarius sp. EC-HK134]VVT02383.1 hypothetical protein RV420_260142 [Roseovarius sp. EC-SD190]
MSTNLSRTPDPATEEGRLKASPSGRSLSLLSLIEGPFAASELDFVGLPEFLRLRSMCFQ